MFNESAIEEETERKEDSDLRESTQPENMDYLDKPKDILKSRVSIVDIPTNVKVEFRLILQNLKIPFDKLTKFFPKSKRITLSELVDHFKSLKRFESDQLVEQICRYLVENDTKGDIIKYDENADLDKIAIGRLFLFNLFSFEIQK